LFIEVPAEYQAKLAAVAQGFKDGSVKYEEEYIYNKDDGTVQWKLYVNGEQIKDHGVVKIGVEDDHISDDGRNTRVSSRLLAF
jgi:hypothetical protein